MPEYMTRSVDDGELYVGPPDDPNRYRLGNTVGKGGEGEVVRAQIHSAEQWQDVAIKVWRTPEAGDPGFEVRAAAWREQLNLVQFLHHPGIVGMREVFVGAPQHKADQVDRPGRALYLVMNWAQGLSLATWAVSNPNPDYGRLHAIVVAIGAALAHMHSGLDTGGQPIVHADLKPGNVIIGDEDSVKIVDFGLAQGAARTDHRGRTPGYSAPEVAAGGPPSVRADMFALGAITFFLMAGANPPEMYDAKAIRAALLASPLVGHQPELIDHICWAMAERPEDRPSDAAQWAAGLANKSTLSVMAGGGGAVLPPPAPGPTGTRGPDPVVEPQKERRRVLPVLAALVALALIGGGLAWRATHGEKGPAALATESTTPSVPTTVPSTGSPTTAPIGTTTVTQPSTTTTRAPVTTVPRKTYLDDKSLLVDGGFDTSPTSINGVDYQHALYGDLFDCAGNSDHSNSATFNLGRHYQTFHAVAGVTDTAANGTTLRFEVFADEHEVFNEVGKIGQALPIDLDVNNVLRLELKISAFAGCNQVPHPNYGAFADPYVS